MKKRNARELAMDLLVAIEEKQAYSNLLLNTWIDKYKLEQKDAALLTELVYGTIQRKLTLDYYLSHFLEKKKKISNWVIQLLRISLYQMVYLDRIPDRAVLYEAVEIAKKRGHKGIAALVNGVLRNIQRKGLPTIKDIQDPIERTAVKTSAPKWLVERLASQYGFETAENILSSQLLHAKQTARVNKLKTTVPQAIAALEKEGIEAVKGKLVDEAIEAVKGNLANTSLYQKGWFTIQDESSMLVSLALQVKEGEQILDACAAPGGKSTHIAELLNNTGKVVSLDLHEHKIQLIEKQASRLGLLNVNAKVLDSRNASEHFPPNSFDKILVDAPCSGFGVIRKKPEIKYTKTEEDILSLTSVQKKILASVADLVKPGGLLVYSTCTIDKQENEEMIKYFLKEHDDFQLDETLKDRMPEKVRQYVENGFVQILPQYFNTDGFFIAALRRKVQ